MLIQKSLSCFISGHYQALGRVIHMNYLRERLRLKGVNFEATRRTMDVVERLDILADTLYIEENSGTEVGNFLIPVLK